MMHFTQSTRLGLVRGVPGGTIQPRTHEVSEGRVSNSDAANIGPDQLRCRECNTLKVITRVTSRDSTCFYRWDTENTFNVKEPSKVGLT